MARKFSFQIGQTTQGLIAYQRRQRERTSFSLYQSLFFADENNSNKYADATITEYFVILNN